MTWQVCLAVDPIKTSQPDLNISGKDLTGLFNFATCETKFFTYHKSTYSGLLLNFDSFTSPFYITSLIKCLIVRPYKINNIWASFHNDVTKIKETSYFDKVHSNSDLKNAFLQISIYWKMFWTSSQKSCQKSVNNSAKMLILKLFLLLLKLITISQLKIKHPTF